MKSLRLFLILALLLVPCLGVSDGSGRAYVAKQIAQAWDSADTVGSVAAPVAIAESVRLPRKDADTVGVLSFGQSSAAIRYHAVAPVTRLARAVSARHVIHTPRAPPEIRLYLIA